MGTASAPAEAGPWPAGAGLVPGDPPLAEHAVTTTLALRTEGGNGALNGHGEPSATQSLSGLTPAG
jgi:hypothetical protein